MSVVEFEKLPGHIGLITLNRPQQRNAVNADVTSQMSEIMAKVDSDDDIWVAILTGKGKVFCAGADLKAFGVGLSTEEGGFAGLTNRKRVKPLIAAIEGPALAGGCELALACDLIVASEQASFGVPEVKRNLAAAAGGLFRLPKRLPYHIAMEMVLTGDPITASRASQYGLVNRLVKPGEAVETAKEVAKLITVNAPIAVQESRNVVAQSAHASEKESWALSEHAIGVCMGSPDFNEGLLAFRQKRSPNWSGQRAKL